MSSAWSAGLGRMDGFLLPCPFKHLTGLDCPGCGFQRAAIALIQGNLQKSLVLYPPLIPLLIMLVIVLVSKTRGKPLNVKTVKIMYLITGSVIMISYIFKISIQYLPALMATLY